MATDHQPRARGSRRLAFTVKWSQSLAGDPEGSDDTYSYEVVGGVLNISGPGGNLIEQFSPAAWLTVRPFSVTPEP